MNELDQKLRPLYDFVSVNALMVFLGLIVVGFLIPGVTGAASGLLYLCWAALVFIFARTANSQRNERLWYLSGGLFVVTAILAFLVYSSGTVILLYYAAAAFLIGPMLYDMIKQNRSRY
jgi:hypothetical protein